MRSIQQIFSTYQTLYQRLLADILPSTGRLWLLLVLILAENLCTLLPPWLIGQLSEILFGISTPFPGGYRSLLILLFLVICIQSTLAFASRYLSTITSEQIVMKMRESLYDHLQRLPICFHAERKHGKTLSLLSYDISIIGNFLTSTVISLIPHLLTALGALICVASIKPLMAVIGCLLLPVFILTTKLLGRQVHGVSKKLMEQYGTTFGIVEENLANLPLIKAYTTEKNELLKFQHENSRLFSLSKDYFRLQGRLGPTTRVLSAGLVLFAIWILAADVQQGVLQPGELVSLLLYGMLLVRPITSLAEIYGQIQRCRAAAQRLSDVLSLERETDTGSVDFNAQGDIVFDRVSFTYPDRPPLFADLSLTIPAGTTVAIIGKNGVGKSSLVQLLLRLYTPSKGTIRLGGRDIQRLDLETLRSRIGYVQQLVFLKNESLRHNLRYGTSGVSDQEILKVCNSVGLSEFIDQLPRGLDTVIGDRGTSLSGGQRQKIALARALLKNPDILILDEATAMFDPKGELAFIKNCKELLSGKTVLLITHRSASLELADIVVSLDENPVSIRRNRSSTCHCQEFPV